MAYKKRLLVSSVVLTVLVACLSIAHTAAVYASEMLYYSEYLSNYSGVKSGTDELIINAVDYSEATGATVDGNYLITGDLSTVTYSFELSEAGMYNIAVMYKAIAGGPGISRSVYINGEIPFREAEGIIFDRFYRDINQDFKNQVGNQAYPAQVEVEVWTEKLLNSANGHIIEPFQFYFESGNNSITFQALEADMIIDYIVIKPVLDLPVYSDYYANHINNGATPISNFEAIRVQGESAVLKSSPSLYPINDRTSSLMEPYHPSYIILNAIGGNAWRIPGQIIKWEVEAPEAGLYKIAFKYKQSINRGTFSTRSLSINGEIPFLEARELRFYFNNRYSLDFLGNEETGEEYYFYLNEGVNTISLEVTLGVFGELSERVGQSLDNLNGIYREIIVITSSTPDKYRDYQLGILIPDLFTRFTQERDKIQAIADDINNISGSFTFSTSIINRLLINLNRIIDDPAEIASYLADFKSSVTALGDWMLSVQSQPLTIDFFVVAYDGHELPRAADNFFQLLWHNIRAFIGSFTNDFFVKPADETESTKTIEVWLSTGRDPFQILNRMINETFTPETGINVNIKLVNADVVFPATLTGNGPDVNISLAASTPINFGYRDGAYDLTLFSDFDEIAQRFVPAAIETFSFRGATYALPDQMSFPVMFYRTDIFEKTGITEIPTTMNEFLAIVPILQTNNMDIYFTTAPQSTLGSAASQGSTRNIIPVYVSLLNQNGGELYYNDGQFSAITSDIGIQTFKFWTELYTKHNFIVETDFATRFRMGEIPVGIVDFTVYNTLAAAAPEIRGDWKMAQVPGTLQSDGTVRHDIPLSVSGSSIVKNTVESKGTLDEAWEFLKWWTSTETQYAFAIEMESVLGLAGRFPVANLEAFSRIPWGRENLQVLLDSLEWARAVPQVPGSYITGRVIENAFLTVINGTVTKNPTDVIYEAVDEINQELESKRREFGIID